ncbi:MAG TPA: tetratricopeptide repeat protein [Thermoanaerobaculia bacterium]|nr:tetratricopeptide repeat protein [Thermoanaerobaculia bacterium]
MPRRLLILLVTILLTVAAFGADQRELQAAQQLAWDKRFSEAEAMYRRILVDDPRSNEAKLGLARVVMWQGRYAEAIAMFRELQGIEALEGRATAEYWTGDLRSAARDFRKVLAIDAEREFARTSLAEIAATARPSERVSVDAVNDDQPLDAVRAEAASTFFSDPLTRWSVVAGAYRLDAGRIGKRDGEYVAVENETRLGAWTFGGSAGLFTFPDGVRRPIGSVMVRHRSLTFRVEHREEIASATSLRTHAASTTAALRWSHDRNWIGAAEVSHRRYFDGNRGNAAIAYAVAPWRRGEWTFWGGGSVALRDTEESRFRLTAVSSTLDAGFFRYQYRGEYDPYWTPDDLVEGRLVAAVERRTNRGGVKLHADGGYARDRGRAFGPDAGPGPFPSSTFTFAFDRNYRPWRAGIAADFAFAAHWRIEAGVERSVTVDYRSTSVHASLVRRR